jgi:D-apiose dehydrogenase
MTKLRFAFFGAGFWARFQMAGWKELGGAECVAVYNRTKDKGKEFAARFGVPAFYDDPEELLREERIDFVDLCTNPFTLPDFVRMMAEHKMPVISQKPMAPSVEVGRELVRVCKEALTPYFIHENWRWQEPIRRLKAVLDSGDIGSPFRARITMVSGFPVFANEPTLSDLENFILTDLGTHILDTARFLFGEASSAYCQIHRVHPSIKGEDVATVMLDCGGRTTVTCEMAYAENYIEHEYFPQTLIFIEGENGSAELAGDYWLRTTTRSGTCSKQYPPKRYPWADMDYLPVHASIVPCNAHLLAAMRGEVPAETTGADNLKTIELTFACYESARNGKAVRLATS